MVENGTLIEKIEKHPRIWLAAAALLAIMCILGGLSGIVIRPGVTVGDMENAPYFGHAEGEVSEHDSAEDIGIRNSFCRFIPTGSEYYYRVCTDDGAWIYVRAGKNDEFAGGRKIEGRVRKFSDDEREYLRDKFAHSDEYFLDMTWLRTDLLLIASGVLIVLDIVLAALMIKNKIAADNRFRTPTEIVLCAVPFVTAAIWIYLKAYI